MLRVPFIQFLVLAGLLVFPAQASHFAEEGEQDAQAEGPKLAVPFRFGFTEEMNAFPKEALQTIGTVGNMGFGIIQLSKPQGDTVFKWDGDKAPLKDKEFALEITTSEDPRLKELAKLPGGVLPKNMDSLTTVGKKKDGTYVINTMLLADRIFYDENRVERKDAFTRMVTAMAHEIHGNVQFYLKQDLATLGVLTPEKRKQSEVMAFQATVDFLERFRAMPEFKNLSDKIQNDFAEALKREKEGLESWKNK